jgi:hypothetical protein
MILNKKKMENKFCGVDMFVYHVVLFGDKKKFLPFLFKKMTLTEIFWLLSR